MTDKGLPELVKELMEKYQELGSDKLEVDYGTMKVSIYKVGLNIRIDINWKGQ